MRAKTKIVVLHSKELLYTGLFILLGILFLLLLIFMFRPASAPPASYSAPVWSQELYTPGIYTTCLDLKNQRVNLEIVVDEAHINSIRLVNLEETVPTLFPIMEEALTELTEQILKQQSLDTLSYSQEHHHSASLLLDAITYTLHKAQTF